MGGMDVAAVLRGLLQAGLTQAELAERLHTTQPSVSRWLAGAREPSGPAMLLIRELAVEHGILDDAVPERRDHTLAIMGYIGAGAEIDTAFEQLPPEGIEEVTLPYAVDEGLVGFIVRGDSMVPRVNDGEIVVVETEQSLATERLMFQEAAVRTYDGHRYVKRIMPGARPHVYDLESINGRNPTIRNVRIAWASAVRMIIPNVGLKRIGRKTAKGRRGAAERRR